MASFKHLGVVTSGLIVLFFLVSCARPNYQDPANSNPQSPAPETKPQAPGAPEAPCELSLKSAQLCLHLQWLKKPNSTEYSHFQIQFKKLNSTESLSPEELNQIFSELAVVLWMPSMGHGSTPVKLFHKSPGVIDVENVFFIMPGDWEIRIQLKHKMEIYDQITLNIFI